VLGTQNELRKRREREQDSAGDGSVQGSAPGRSAP
jgi:hypothetical protein